MNYSLTMGGLIVAVVVPVLAQVGFSQSCANEIITVALPLAGGALAWFGRWRAGGVSALGMKK
jgi:hypothetical protein